MTREELAEYQRSKRYKFRSELMCLANSVGNAKDAEKASVALDKLEEYVISRQKLLLEKIGKPDYLAVHILRNWDRGQIERFAKHLLGSESLIDKERTGR